MKFTTVSTIIALSGAISNANITETPKSEFNNCFKITPTPATTTNNHSNLPKLVCFDSSLSEESVYAELESFLSANQVEKQDVILAQWTEIKD